MERISIKQSLIDFLKENRASVFGYLFFSLATPIANIYLPHLYGQIIAVLNEKKEINRQVKIRFVCILMLWILVQLFWAAMTVIDSKFIPKLRSHVRKYIVDRVLSTYREDYSEEELGGIMAELERLPDEVDHMFGNIRNHILPMLYMLVFSIGYFTWTNPKLGAVSIVSIGLYLGVTIQFSKKCIPAWTDMDTSHSVLYGEINDCLGNLLNIYAADQDLSELKRLDNYEAHFLERHRRAIRCAGNFRLWLNLCYIFLFCSINVLSFYLFSKKLMQLSEVVSVLIVSLELISKMAAFVGSIDRIMYELTTIKNVQDTLDKLSARKTTSIESLTGTRQVDLDGDIVLKDLGVKYNGGTALQGINVRIPRGSTTLIVGEIGSGKTSLINALMRLIPYTGTIFVAGVDSQELALGCLRSQVLYVPQNPRLFNRTIYENISYGNNISREKVQKVLSKYQIQIDINRPVGKFGQWLSGGQRQIVYLLRCLFKDAPIVLLDEPTASLDRGTKEEVLKLLADLLTDRTVIIVSHDPDVLQYADQIIELKRN